MSIRNQHPRDRVILGYQLSRRRVQRSLAALLTALVVFVLLMARLRPEAVSYQIGDTATRTIRAQRAATYVDREATDRLREDAALSIPDVYTRDAGAEGRALQTLRDVFETTLAVREDESAPTPLDKLDHLRERLDLQFTPTTLRLLIESSHGSLMRVQQAAALLVRQAMSKQVRSNTQDLAQVRLDLATAAQQTNLTPRFRQLLVELAQVSVEPNLIYDTAATAMRRDEARKQVQEVRRQIQPSDIVIAQGEQVTQRHLDMFAALGLSRPSVDYIQALTLLGVILFLMLALSLFMRGFVPDVYYDNLGFTLLCAVLIAVAGLFSVFRGATWFQVLGVSAASSAAIFLALTTRPLAAAGAALFLGGLATLASGNDVQLLLSATLCALLASHFVRPRESRSSTVARAALLTALANIAVFTVVSYVFGFTVSGPIIGQVALAGLLSTIVAAGVISVIERPLGLTTHLRLLELQNPNEPALKRLLTEAPGSYQSSVMVANIAEPAADAIGADPVLTRTCCMYHDIGKLKRSYFFVENQFGAENPHERLSPHLSALVLMSHVKDGLEMAEEYKLPPVVASIIAQHHGTALVSFMYQRAQAEAAEGEEVSESDFRYPGPKPQTRENAIIMLADTVEAAARTLDEPTRPKIEAMVERLVDARIADGQLDESPLTFADITVIKKSFVNTLAGMFHQRLAYPSATLNPTPAAADTTQPVEGAPLGDFD